MPPTLKRLAYHVWIAPDGVDPDAADESDLECHHVVVNAGDQLRGELEANKQGLPKGGQGAPMHLTAIWLWATLVRTKRYAGNFQEFKTACVSFDPDKDRDEPHTDPEAETDDLDARPTVASTG